MSGTSRTKPQDLGCCQVEAVVTVDARGQLVLPKDVREQAGIQAGDKLAVVLMQKGGQNCCLSLIKVDAIAGMVRSLLGPIAQEIVGKQGGAI
jgi:AbrB family looped-hinge helix DNA binding protein